MPTEGEMWELLSDCKWKWTTYKGVKGYNVKGPNGNTIFLPAAGGRHGSSLYNAGSFGVYWSSTPSGHYNGNYAYNLLFYSGYQSMYYDDRYYGLSVRPVVE